MLPQMLTLIPKSQSWMENLSDTNVVKVNGSKISAPTKISKGDIAEVGGVLISFGEQASRSSAILARRRTKTAVSGLDDVVVVGAADDQDAQEAAPATEKAPNTLSPETDDYDTCSTTEQAALSSPESVEDEEEEQKIMAAIGTASSPHGSKMLARKIRAQQHQKWQGRVECGEDKEVAAEDARGVLGAVLEEEHKIMATIGTASSPHGSRLLARKIRAQQQQKSREQGKEIGGGENEENTSVGAASLAAQQNEEAAAGTAGIIAHFGAAMELSRSPADGYCRTRTLYNRLAFSPSMGLTEEEHMTLQDAYASQAASPVVQHQQRCLPSTAIEAAFASPHAARQLLGQQASALPDSALASLDRDARLSYNQKVHSPSMNMTEAEVMALRQQAAASRAAGVRIDEVDDDGTSEEQQQADCTVDSASTRD
jgi:hypothetical protein